MIQWHQLLGGAVLIVKRELITGLRCAITVQEFMSCSTIYMNNEKGSTEEDSFTAVFNIDIF